MQDHPPFPFNQQLNIIIFGADRSPDVSRPALINLFRELKTELHIYVGIISLSQNQYDFERELTLTSEWISSLATVNPAWQVKVFKLFQQSKPDLYGSPDLLSHSFRLCSGKIDVFYNQYLSIKNYLHYLYFSDCFNTILSPILSDRLTILLRPDVLYEGISLTPLIDPKINSSRLQSSAYVIAHDSLGMVNDRFLASHSETVLAYMQRIRYLPHYFRLPWRFFHSELYSHWFLSIHLKLKLLELPLEFRADRVRASGQILDDSNPLNYRLHKKIFRPFFRRHYFWQLKISLMSIPRFLFKFSIEHISLFIKSLNIGRS